MVLENVLFEAALLCENPPPHLGGFICAHFLLR